LWLSTATFELDEFTQELPPRNEGSWILLALARAIAAAVLASALAGPSPA
jgi:hypothetical protein